MSLLGVGDDVAAAAVALRLLDRAETSYAHMAAAPGLAAEVAAVLASRRDHTSDAACMFAAIEANLYFRSEAQLVIHRHYAGETRRLLGLGEWDALPADDPQLTPPEIATRTRSILARIADHATGAAAAEG